MDWPYLVGPGWWELLDQQFARMREIDPEVEVDVKEKYGMARVNLTTEKDGAFESLHKIALETEEQSGRICEICGQPGKVVNQRGWLSTFCDRCAALDDKARWKIREETEEQYYRSSHARHGEPQGREEVREKKLQDFLSDNRQKAAESLFGILPPDAKGKRFYTQEEVEQELSLDKEVLKDLNDVEFEDEE